MSYTTATAISNYIASYEAGTYPQATNQTEVNIYNQINKAYNTMNTDDFEDYLYELDLNLNSFE